MKRASPAWAEAFCVGALLALFALLCVGSMRVKSITYDETTYYGIGKDILEHGSWEAPLASDQPPLSYYIHSLPLLGSEEDELGTRKRLGYPHLAAARRAMLPVALVLGFAVYLWSRSLMGPAAGLLSLALYATSPNMIAHARLITPDVTLSCFFLLSCLLLWHALRTRKWGFVLTAGAALGLAQLSKFTAALLVPALALVLTAEALRRRLPPAKAIAIFAALCVVAVLVLNCGYGFRGTLKPVADHVLEGRSFARLERLPAIGQVPLPFPYLYTKGLTHQHSIVQAGFPGYLMGEHSTRGWWYYFFVALGIKTPPALHLALLGSVLAVLTCAGHPLRERSARAGALLIPPAVLLFYASFLNHINIGLRYVLPVLPFLHVAAGALVAGRGCRTPVRRVCGGVLATLGLVSALLIYPHYLAYFNVYVGGPENGYHYLIDSNLDWGQDEFLMARYAESSPVPLKIEPGCRPTTGRIAVSANTLQGIYGDTGECYAWLKAYEPVDHVGYSWLIFDVPDNDPDTEAQAR
jgi:4-amino-4-deoxy-L-arabinose transferase-like glycosyltransferase